MRSRPFARRAGHALVALAMATPPASAAAQASFDFGAISVAAKRFLHGGLAEQQTDVAPAGSPALASVLEEPIGMARFPTSQSALPLGFVSALMTGTGFGGVGVSFVSPHTPDHAAVAEWSQDYTNQGTAAGTLRASFDIPRMEASLLAGPSYGTFPTYAAPLAFAGARLVATLFAANGTQLSTTTVFDYHLSIERRFQGDDCGDINDFVVSPALAARVPNGVQIIEQGDVCGIFSIPFAGSVALPTVGPGERLRVDYVLVAENLASRTRTPELGYQAFVGDPFQVTGGGGIRIAPTTVPEPATAALLAAGLALGAAAAVRPRARARRTARTRGRASRA